MGSPGEPPRPSLTGSSAAEGSAPLTVGGPPHFKLLGIPIRVGFGFWIMAFLLGSSGRGARFTLTWTAVVFFSVLLHEMGHALVARRFGAHPAITLHALGGLTRYEAAMSRPRSALVSLAGPGVGLLFGIAVALLARAFPLTQGRREIVAIILWVNIGWGVINLLPVLPFDGGNVLAAILGPRRALATALISAIVGGGIATWAIVRDARANIWIALLFGTAAISAVGQARLAWKGSADTRDRLDDVVARARAAVARGDFDEAEKLAREVIARARSASMRGAGWTALAWAYVGRGDGRLAREALRNVEPKGAIDPYTVAAVEDTAGEPRRARDILLAVRGQGLRSAEMTKLLIDLYAREGRLDEAAAIAAEDTRLLDADDARAVVRAASDAGAHRAAAVLSARLFELFGDGRDALELARSLARAGDTRGALDALERAVAGGTLDRGAIAVDAAFATLVGDAQFERLVRG